MRRNRWTTSVGMGGRHGSESVDGLPRNRWSTCVGISSHTYLFNVTDIEALAAKFRTAILPLLAEYFYDDWSKIRHVLGGAPFVVAKPPGDHGSGLEDEGLLDPDTAIHEVLPATAEEWLDPIQYRRIYDESVSSGGDQREDESPDIGDGQS